MRQEKKIIYANGDPSYFLVGESIIKGHGFAVDTFTDSKKAFAMIEKSPEYFAIISGFKFKSWDGITFF